jgi:tRNA_anti-like
MSNSEDQAGATRFSIMTLIAWAYAIIIGLAGLVGVLTGDIFTGLLFVCSAIVALPLAADFVWRSFNVAIPGWLRATGAFVLLVAAGASIPPTKAPASSATSTAAQTFQPDPRGVSIAKLMLLDDFHEYLGGRKVVGDWSKLVPIEERVTARELYVYYNNNEVAADDRFKGKSILLAGVIEKISKDIFGSAYLVIDAGGILESVQASLATETGSHAGNFSPQTSIALICTGNGMILTSPMLKDCQTAEVTFDLKRAEIENMANDFLAGRSDNLSGNMKMLIGYSYAIGVSMPRGGACEAADVSDMTACISTLGKTENNTEGKALIAASYATLAKHITLPPLLARLGTPNKKARAH